MKKTNMKRILLTLIAALLAVVMCFAFVGCSNDSDDDEDEDKDNKTSVSDKVDKDDEDKDDEDKDDEDKDDEDKDDEDKDDKKDTDDDSDPVAEYVEENEEEFVSAMEQAFESSSGSECDIEVYAEDGGIVVDIYILDFEDISDEQKETMQETYDGMSDYYESLLESMQTELPELEYIKYNLYDKNGDFLACAGAGY